MDFFRDAFGGFNPQSDVDAALKLSLDALMADGRIAEMTTLIDTESLGGIEGEPGWLIERRQVGDIRGFETWPSFADFHAHVNPGTYSPAFPDFSAMKILFSVREVHQ